MLGGFGALITGAALGLWRKSFGRSGTLDAGPAAGPEASLSGTRATMPGEATPTTTSTVMAATQPAPTTPGVPPPTISPPTTTPPVPTTTQPAPPPQTNAPPTTTSPTTTSPPATTTSTPASTTSTTGVATGTRTLDVIERAGWGAGSQIGDFPSHTVDRITVHHSAGVLSDNRRAPGRLRGYQTRHQDRGFVDVAYHFMIDLNGNVYEARDHSIPGETFTSYDPTNHFLPMLDANFETQGVNAAQLSSLVSLVAWAVEFFGVGVETIAGHRDYAATSVRGRLCMQS